MGIPCHVNVVWDITAGMLTHSLIPPPPAPPVKVPAVPSIEMIATQMWTLGFLCGQNKLTTTVLHKGVPMIQEGHDQGMMIPDVTIPPANIWYLAMWPMSSRKVMFFSSLVHYDKKGAGCTSLFLPFPMLTCGEPISAPTARPLTNLLNTVIVSLSPGDILMGIGRIAFSMALDAIFNKLSSPSPPGTGSAWSQAGKELLSKLCPTDPLGWAKLALSGLSGVIFPSPTEGPKFEMKIGMPGVAEGGISISGTETSVGASAFGGNDNQGGFGAAASTGVKYGDGKGTRGFGDASAGSPDSGGAKGTGGGSDSGTTGGGAKGTGGDTTQSGGSKGTGSSGSKGTGGTTQSDGGSKGGGGGGGSKQSDQSGGGSKGSGDTTQSGGSGGSKQSDQSGGGGETSGGSGGTTQSGGGGETSGGGGGMGGTKGSEGSKGTGGGTTQSDQSGGGSKGTGGGDTTQSGQSGDGGGETIGGDGGGTKESSGSKGSGGGGTQSGGGSGGPEEEEELQM